MYLFTSVISFITSLFTLEDKATTTTVGSNISTGSKPNAFVIMMSTAHKKGAVNSD